MTIFDPAHSARPTLASLLAANLAMLSACGPTSPSIHKNSPQSGIGFSQFLQTAEAQPSPRTAGPDNVSCDSLCHTRRLEFRYVVYVGKQIYAYWEEKKKETGTDFEALAHALEQSITSSSTATDYYLTLRAWASAFHDGHVNALGKEGDTELDVYTAPVRLETLAPGTDHEKVIVSQVRDPLPLGSGIDLKPGAEVLAVNGKPVSQALDEAEKLTSGSTRRMRRLLGARRLVDAMGAKAGAEPLALTVRPLDDEAPREVVLYRTAELVERTNSSEPNGNPDGSGRKYFSAMILPGGLGYLRIDAFLGSQSSLLLDQAMSRLMETRGLLIDLRRNGGGDQSGNVILSRLIESSIARYQTSERIGDFTLSLRPSYFSLDWSPGEPFARWHEQRVVPAVLHSRYLDKPVIALIGPNCFSACDTFVAALKSHRLATIMGEATGGGTGTPLVFELPFSKQSFRYSVVRGITASGEPIEGSGTAPDLVIEPTVKERSEGRDEQLAAALNHLSRMIQEKKALPPPSPRPQAGTPESQPPGPSIIIVPAPPHALDRAIGLAARELGQIWAQDPELSPTRSEIRELRSLAPVDELHVN